MGAGPPARLGPRLRLAPEGPALTSLPGLPIAYRWRWHSLATFAVLEAARLERPDAWLTLAEQCSGLLYAPTADQDAQGGGQGGERAGT